MAKKKITNKKKNNNANKDKNKKNNNKIIPIVFIVLVLIAGVFLYPIIKSSLRDKNSVEVYFVKTYAENQYKLMPVTRKTVKDETRTKTAFTELLAGPAKNEKKQGYFTEIPKDTKLIKISENQDKIIINLSREFEIGGGSESMTLRLEQVVNTALDNAGEKPVYLEIEGQQIKYIGGEGIMVPQPLSRNLNKSTGT